MMMTKRAAYWCRIRSVSDDQLAHALADFAARLADKRLELRRLLGQLEHVPPEMFEPLVHL